MISTGGTSGSIKFAMHTWKTFTVSAKATQNFLGTERVNSLSCLPVHHVSGFMQFVRAIISGGNIVPFENLKDINKGEYVTSIVPTQLRRLTNDPKSVKELKELHTIFIGGASTTEDLVNKAKAERLSIALTYGATETASMVCVNGKPLHHTKIEIQDNQVRISADSLFYGYFPNTPKQLTYWKPQDEGYFDNDGNLNITGRSDRIIITGGEKVDPHEVERTIIASGLVESILVWGKPDEEWG